MTCRLSAGCWLVGSVLVLVVTQPSVALVASYGVQALVVLPLLRCLGRSASPRRDEALISAIAILGRGCILVLLGHAALVHQGPVPRALVLAAVAVMSLLFARAMVVTGPVTRVLVLVNGRCSRPPDGPPGSSR